MNTKINPRYEPVLDPDTGTVKVGDLTIPSAGLLTSLLYGFAHAGTITAKEYYFWRTCDMLWNRPDLPEPLMIRNPWTVRMIREALHNKYLAIGGAANSSKSHTMAAWGIVNFLSQPADTLVMITSTTLREARKRIWGSVIQLLSVIQNGPYKIRDSIGSVAYITEGGVLIERSGISLIAAEKSQTREAVGKFIGIKQKRVILIGDELSELSEAIINAGLSNLSKNDYFQMIGMSNPNSRFDAFGIWAEPKGGWDTVDTNTADEWITRWNGKYIRFDGEKSPNILAGKTIYRFLPTIEKIEEDREILKASSRAYMRMVRAVFFDSEEEEGVYNESEIAQSASMKSVRWSQRPIKIAGLDPAFTNGGDRTILYIGQVGYDQRGQYVFELLNYHQLYDDARNAAVPRTYQIVEKVKELCQKEGVDPSNLAVDSTGAGSPFCDVLSGEWSPNFMRVSFGSKPTKKKVGANSNHTGEDLYVNRVSELWFSGKELMRTKQLYGVTSELASEIVGRKYELLKKGSLKMRIESKAQFKERLGKSPDVADAAFLCLDAARQRFGLSAVEPPSEEDLENPRYTRQRKTISSLKAALGNPETQPVSH